MGNVNNTQKKTKTESNQGQNVFILINEPWSPLYDWTIVSVMQPSQEAKVKANCRHRDYPKDEIEMIVPLDRLRRETGASN